MNTSVGLSAAISCIVIFLGAALSDVVAQQQPVREIVAIPPIVSLKDVFGAWSKRADRVRSARFEWEDVSTNTPVSSPLGPLANAAPAKPMTLNHRLILILDGDKVRLEVNGPSWSGTHNKIVDRDYRLVRDGDTETSLVDMRRGGADPVGFVNHAIERTQSQTLHNRPLFLHFRPFLVQFPKLSLDLWRISQSPGLIDGRQYVVLESTVGNNHAYRFYVDPERDYAVVRVEYLNGQKVEFSEDIAYEKNLNGEWAPSKWSGTLRGRRTGRVIEGCNATMVRHRLNLPVRPDEFELTFPDGTRVTELRGGARETYVALPGGKRGALRRIDRQSAAQVKK